MGVSLSEMEIMAGMKPFSSSAPKSILVYTALTKTKRTTSKTSRTGLRSRDTNSFQPRTAMARMVHSGGPLALSLLAASWAVTAWLTTYATSDSTLRHAFLQSTGPRSTREASSSPGQASEARSEESSSLSSPEASALRALPTWGEPSDPPSNLETARSAIAPAASALASWFAPETSDFGPHTLGIPLVSWQKFFTNLSLAIFGACLAAPSTSAAQVSEAWDSRSSAHRSTSPSGSPSPPRLSATLERSSATALARAFLSDGHVSSGRSSSVASNGPCSALDSDLLNSSMHPCLSSLSLASRSDRISASSRARRSNTSLVGSASAPSPPLQSHLAHPSSKAASASCSATSQPTANSSAPSEPKRPLKRSRQPARQNSSCAEVASLMQIWSLELSSWRLVWHTEGSKNSTISSKERRRASTRPQHLSP
mmetsp:Transcript_9322/g.33417  ORF Transcript_9322/g.33417 Transcript_9322/m.33417 type:complete len:427 (+) Transcript_9322:776-2056(+)